MSDPIPPGHGEPGNVGEPAPELARTQKEQQARQRRIEADIARDRLAAIAEVSERPVFEALMAERGEGKEGWWYLSFVGEEGFRGALILWAWGVVTGAALAHLLRLNPGGQVFAVRVPEARYSEVQGCTDRLLPLAELEALLGPTIDLATLQDSEPCPACEGRGYHGPGLALGRVEATCNRCNGSGMIGRPEEKCGTCGGYGGVESGLPAHPDRIVECPECHGSGRA